MSDFKVLLEKLRTQDVRLNLVIQSGYLSDIEKAISAIKEPVKRNVFVSQHLKIIPDWFIPTLTARLWKEDLYSRKYLISLNDCLRFGGMLTVYKNTNGVQFSYWR